MDIEDYKNKLSIFQYEFDEKIRKLSKEYALSNNTIKVGDIITSFCCTIKIDEIKYSLGNDKSMPECRYRGAELTKKMMPRKDGARSAIWQSDLSQYNKQLAAKEAE